MLFTVIQLLWLIWGPAWQANLDAIYSDPASLAHLDKLGEHISTQFPVILLLCSISEELGRQIAMIFMVIWFQDKHGS